MEPNDSRWMDEHLAKLDPEPDWQPNSSHGLARLKQQADAERAHQRLRLQRWGWITAATAATSVSLMAFPETRAFAQRCASACVSESTRVKHFLMGAPAIHSVVTEGRAPAPDFTLVDAAGQTVRLSDFRGKVVLLNFWATWCLPCRTEIPWFTEFQRTYGDRGFAVLGVSMDDDGWTSVRPYMESAKVNYRMMIGNENVTGLFGGVTALPATLIIDKSGRIAMTHTGICERSAYESEIRSILAE